MPSSPASIGTKMTRLASPGSTVRTGILLAAVLLLLFESIPRQRESATRSPAAPAAAAMAAPRLPLEFEPNVGQVTPRARYVGRGNGMTLLFAPDGVVFTATPSVLQLRFVDAEPDVRLVASDPRPGRSHYLSGDDPSTWRTAVPRFGTLRYVGVYPGIDVVFRDNGSSTEYDFIVAPAGDPNRIRLALEGAENVDLEAGGDLVATSGPRRFVQRAPTVFQETDSKRSAVEGAWRVLEDGTIGFDVGRYDPARELVIDPVVEFATYLGGSGSEIVHGIAVDPEGNVLITGETASVNFPVEDALDGILSGTVDAFVAKVDGSGRRLIFATYLGGTMLDSGRGIAVGPAGNIHVIGTTNSTDFPTVTALQSDLAGMDDAFVARLDRTGSTLELSTYLGGSGIDSAAGLSVDSLGAIYVSGLVQSNDFPVTNGVFQPTYGGSGDIYVTKIGASGNLEYSSYLGGSDFDTGGDNVLDSAGNLYVAGTTASADFPVQDGLDGTYGGGDADGFVAKVSHVPLTTGADLEWSTFLGGMDIDGVGGIDLDASGNVHVAGGTRSVDFPVDDDLDSTLDGIQDAFATKLDPTGTSIVHSTLFGGGDFENSQNIAVDAFGQAHVIGSTTSADFPVVEAVQPTFGGGTDAFVLKLRADGRALVWSTYLGGSGGEQNLVLALDARGGVHVAGRTASADFPVERALDSALSGTGDGFIVKLVDPLQFFLSGLFYSPGAAGDR